MEIITFLLLDIYFQIRIQSSIIYVKNGRGESPICRGTNFKINKMTESSKDIVIAAEAK